MLFMMHDINPVMINVSVAFRRTLYYYPGGFDGLHVEPWRKTGRRLLAHGS
jgi:hypothetical protein